MSVAPNNGITITLDWCRYEQCIVTNTDATSKIAILVH